MSDHQDTILYGLKSGAAVAKTRGERLLLTKAADEIASLRARLERVRETLEWYANEDRYDYDQTCCYDGPLDAVYEDDPVDVLCDIGGKARKALRELDSEGSEQETKP